MNMFDWQAISGRRDAETRQQWAMSSKYGDEIRRRYKDLADYRFNQKAIFAYQFTPYVSLSSRSTASWEQQLHTCVEESQFLMCVLAESSQSFMCIESDRNGD